MTEVAKAYAQGLYALAKDEELTATVAQELSVLDMSFSRTPDYLRLLAVPDLSKQERCAILDESFRGKVHPYVLNFMKLLTEKGYIRHFSDCCRAFRERYNEDNGILCVRAVTAKALSGVQQDKLIQKLEQVTGKHIVLTCVVEPACLGGIRLDYDGKRVDGTVSSRLESIGKLLKNTIL